MYLAIANFISCLFYNIHHAMQPAVKLIFCIHITDDDGLHTGWIVSIVLLISIIIIISTVIIAIIIACCNCKLFKLQTP